tara:strand:+ start:2696 stop:3385 length:690 start_codon:yes stop_codon:yes gene_type:complete
MSHRFPKFPLLTPRVPDLEDTNANFYEVAEEVNGRLNEHNWDKASSNGFTASHLATDLFVWHSAGVAQGILANLDGTSSDTPTTGSSWHKIPPDPQWRVVASMSVSFTATGGLLWILASWQLRPNYQQPSTSRTNDDRVDETPCPSFALRINGTVLSESTVGSLDTTNYAFPGLAYGIWPQSTAIMIVVPPGVQTIDLVARAPLVSNDAVWAIPAWVGSRELVVLELRR